MLYYVSLNFQGYPYSWSISRIFIQIPLQLRLQGSGLSVSVFIYTFASACSSLTSRLSILNKKFGFINTYVLTRTCLVTEGVLTELRYYLPQEIIMQVRRLKRQLYSNENNDKLRKKQEGRLLNQKKTAGYIVEQEDSASRAG